MNNLDLKRIKIEKWVGYPLFIGAAIIFAPFAMAAIKGAVGLLVAIGITATSYYLAPATGRLLANMRIKALKAVAAANPIETLENIYAEKKEALLKQRDNIKKRISISRQIARQIEEYESKHNKPSPRRKDHTNLDKLIEIGRLKYEKACVAMDQFEDFISEKRDDWEIAKSMVEASKLASAGQSFTDTLMQDAALRTIQSGLDMSFAELDAAAMDERIDKILSGESVEVMVAPLATAEPKKLSASKQSDIAFDFEPEPQPITINTKN